MASGIGHALEEAQADLAADLGAHEYFKSRGTDQLSQSAVEADPALRKSVADEFDRREMDRARERSQDPDIKEAFQRDVDSARETKERHLEEESNSLLQARQAEQRRQQEIQRSAAQAAANERLRFERDALQRQDPTWQQKQIEEIDRQNLELAARQMTPADMARYGDLYGAIDRLSSQNAELQRQQAIAQAASEQQFQRAVSGDIARYAQEDANVIPAIQAYSESLAQEAGQLGFDVAGYTRHHALQTITQGQAQGLSPAQALYAASRERGWRSAQEVEAYHAQLAQAREQAQEQQRENAELARRREYNQCLDTWLATKRGTRNNLLYDRQFLEKARRSGFINRVGAIDQRP